MSISRSRLVQYDLLSQNYWEKTYGRRLNTGCAYPPIIPEDISYGEILSFIAHKFYGYFPRSPFYMYYEYGDSGCLFEHHKEALKNMVRSKHDDAIYSVARIGCKFDNTEETRKPYYIRDSANVFDPFENEFIGCYIQWDEIRELRDIIDAKSNLLRLLEPLYVTENRIDKALNKAREHTRIVNEVRDYKVKAKVFDDFITKARSLNVIDSLELFYKDPQNPLLDPQHQVFGYFATPYGSVPNNPNRRYRHWTQS